MALGFTDHVRPRGGRLRLHGRALAVPRARRRSSPAREQRAARARRRRVHRWPQPVRGEAAPATATSTLSRRASTSPHFMQARRAGRRPAGSGGHPAPAARLLWRDRRAAWTSSCSTALAERAPRPAPRADRARSSRSTPPRCRGARTSTGSAGRRTRNCRRYLAGWDVAMLPFASNDVDALHHRRPRRPSTWRGARPVVSTSIRDVVQPYGDQGLVVDRRHPRATSRRDRRGAGLRPRRPPRAGRRVPRRAVVGPTWSQMWRHVERTIERARRLAARPRRAQAPAPPSSPGPAGGVTDVRLPRSSAPASPAACSPSASPPAPASGCCCATSVRTSAATRTTSTSDQAGLLVHRYGPHIFHTNSSPVVFEYLSSMPSCSQRDWSSSRTSAPTTSC